MDLRSYYRALRKHLVVILVLVIAGGALGALRYFTETPLYASKMQFYVSTPLPDGGNAQSTDQFAQNRVNSYIQLFSTQELAERVLEYSHSELDVAGLIKQTRATADVGTVLIKVQVTDTDPQQVVQLAEGIAAEFGPLVDELDNVGRTTQLVRIKVVSPPSPAEPISPDRNRLLVIGFGIGLLLGVAYALIRELANKSVSSDDDLAQLTAHPTMGVVPFDPTANQTPLVSDETSPSPRAEALRKLRTRLQLTSPQRQGGVSLITSAVDAEGKTLTAINLALLLGEVGQKVLLVDADLRHPAITALLNLPNSIGLAEVLAGEATLADAVVAGPVDGVWVLPGGKTPTNPAELLGHQQLADLLTQARASYDQVLVDTTAVLPVSDAVEASVLADDVLLVVRADRTAAREVRQAVEILDSVGAPVRGTVLNMIRGK